MLILESINGKSPPEYSSLSEAAVLLLFGLHYAVLPEMLLGNVVVVVSFCAIRPRSSAL